MLQIFYVQRFQKIKSLFLIGKISLLGCCMYREPLKCLTVLSCKYNVGSIIKYNLLGLLNVIHTSHFYGCSTLQSFPLQKTELYGSKWHFFSMVTRYFILFFYPYFVQSILRSFYDFIPLISTFKARLGCDQSSCLFVVPLN